MAFTYVVNSESCEDIEKPEPSQEELEDEDDIYEAFDDFIEKGQ